MRQLLLFALLFSTFPRTSVRAQTDTTHVHKTTLHLTGGAGVSGFMFPNRDLGTSALLEVEIERTLTHRFAVLLGLGGQHTNFEDFSVNYDCPFFLGDKIINYSTGESYRTRRTDLTARLGLAYTIGKFRIDLAAVPAYRVDDQITLTEVITFDASGRPDQVRTYDVRPGEVYERFPESNPAFPGRVEYARRTQLRADLGVCYALTPRLELGLRGRQGLTNDYLTRFEQREDCGFVSCEISEVEAQTINAHDFQLLLTGRLRL